MAFQTGTQVRPELGRADVSGFARAGMITGQALANLGRDIGEGIEKYQKNKIITSTALASLEGNTAKNPEIITLAEEAGGDVAKAFKAIESGDYKRRDVLTAQGFASSYQEQKIAEQQSRLRELQIGKLETEIAAEKAGAMSPAQPMGLDLESQMTILTPPTDESPAGNIVFAGYAKEGPLAGQLVSFDQSTGMFAPVPAGSRPYTVGSTESQRKRLDALTTKIDEDKNAIMQLQKYKDTRAKTGQGLELLRDQIKGNIKVLLGRELTEQEYQTGLAQGLFSGILGQLRIPVLGPGVLTEADAQKLMRAVGGFGATSDPKRVQELMTDFINRRKATYNRALGQYNRIRGTDPQLLAEYSEMKDSVLDTDTSGEGVEDILNELGIGIQ